MLRLVERAFENLGIYRQFNKEALRLVVEI